jgi:hypothetical protein
MYRQNLSPLTCPSQCPLSLHLAKPAVRSTRAHQALSRRRSAPTHPSVQCPFCPSSAPIKGSFPPSCLPSTPPCLLSAGKATAASSSVLVVAAHRRQPSSPPFPPSLQVPGAPPCPEAAPRPLGASPSTPESHRAVAAMVTSCLDIVPLLRCISRAKTLSRHRVVAHGRAPRESSCRPSSRRPSLRAPWAIHSLCYSRAGPGRTPSSLGRADRTHCACGPAALVLARI